LTVSVHKVLAKVAKPLPQTVAELIDKNNTDHPTWMKYLLSSQLDMDRLDYLRRDSLFTGAGYGHFDWHRILTTFELYEQDAERDIIWNEKAKFAIEEFIFARYYMYQNVYLHKTTRGFEKMIEAMWRRAKRLLRDGDRVSLVPAIRRFWSGKKPDVQDYLKIEEYTVLQQIQNWTENSNRSLADLACRFLARNRFVAIDPPPVKNQLAPEYKKWEVALKRLVEKHGYKPGTDYCLRDELKGKYNQPYFPETEEDEQSAKNAIRLKLEGESKPVEISTILDRLKPITKESVGRVRYYVPKDVERVAKKLVKDWKGDT
jgi:HD superfamily phosphohydrolase